MSTIAEVLAKVQAGTITLLDANKIIEEINNTNIKPKVTYKVSEKGAISFYGIRRMPITLYSAEITSLSSIFETDDFKSFVIDNDSKLSKIKKST